MAIMKNEKVVVHVDVIVQGIPSTAFDLVDHGVPWTKITGVCITKSFWKCTQSYLSGRTLQVKLPEVLSRHGEVIAGVPQGGAISPTLFNVHVNDIEDCIPRGIPVSTCKYADDCTLYELVFKDSVSQMQDAVTHLERWAVQNKMELKPSVVIVRVLNKNAV